MARKVKKKRKLKVRKLFTVIFIFTLILLGLAFLADLKINNIIVKGNNLYSDWEII